MRIVLVMLVLIVGLGFYLGWFDLSSQHNKGEPGVILSVDKAKIEADKNTVVDKAQELGHEAAAKIAATTRKALD